VRHSVSRLHPDSGQTQGFGDRGDHRHRPVGGHGEHTVDALATPDLGHRRDLAEVEHLPNFGLAQPGSVWITVDGDRTKAQLAGAHNGASLVPARTDEENRPHQAAMVTLRLRPKEKADAVPALDLTAVRPAESSCDRPTA
jgi:hypothetical protein